jgi:TonB-dependent SusC/RagA subfamily outer membrane receptor
MSSKSLLKKSFLSLFTVIFAAFTLHAQIAVKGSVKDPEGGSIPGASIIIKGTLKGASSDANGNFIIEVSEKTAVLVFSSIGFAPQEVLVGNQTELNVNLQNDSKSLEEVVVTALGIKKDARRIGVAIQSLDGAATVKAREPNAINALAGKVAGLTVGAQPELLRRPNISLRGNSDVLFVVDGVPVNSDTWNVSPDDIETYSVLKGASASALYGFRGKNGAILITTKRGTKDKRGFQVDFNSSTMIDSGFIAIPKVQDEYGPGDH